ncbi:hypothetical protein GmRootA79_38450 [Acidovorax sp. A79]|uniref:hypothetical protein n=2 Tax=Acidovorax TaxID=12916 RepID=UPI001C4935A5|nr:hypothetical protein [Acidovorax sp. sif0732]MBV7428593.1 hypothetical protein [Acidovorax sp. sif0732]
MRQSFSARAIADGMRLYQVIRVDNLSDGFVLSGQSTGSRTDGHCSAETGRSIVADGDTGASDRFGV